MTCQFLLWRQQVQESSKHQSSSSRQNPSQTSLTITSTADDGRRCQTVWELQAMQAMNSQAQCSRGTLPSWWVSCLIHHLTSSLCHSLPAAQNTTKILCKRFIQHHAMLRFHTSEFYKKFSHHRKDMWHCCRWKFCCQSRSFEFTLLSRACVSSYKCSTVTTPLSCNISEIFHFE